MPSKLMISSFSIAAISIIGSISYFSYNKPKDTINPPIEVSDSIKNKVEHFLDSVTAPKMEIDSNLVRNEDTITPSF